MAVSAVAAVVAVGDAVAAAAPILAVVGEVGVGMTVVGAITGNKSLMKVGQTLGMVGGIGSLAGSAVNALGMTSEGLIGDFAPDLASAVSDGASAATDIADTATNVATDVATDATGDVAQISGLASDTAPTIGQNLTGSTVDNLAPAMTTPAGTSAVGQSLTNSTANNVVASQLPGAATSITTPGVSQGVQDVTQNVINGGNTNVATAAGDTSSIGGGASSAGSSSVTGQVGTQPISSPSFMTQLKNSILKNPGQALQIGGNLLSGVAQGYAADQQRKIQEAQLAMAQQRQDWGNQVPRITYTAPNTAGIISSKRGG